LEKFDSDPKAYLDVMKETLKDEELAYEKSSKQIFEKIKLEP
jgi:hypothetical protein